MNLPNPAAIRAKSFSFCVIRSEKAASFGAISRSTGRVKNANSTWLIGRPFDVDLVRVLGRPVRLANDANCFALSEAIDGAAAGAATVFGVILGTGVGGGIVVNQHVINGVNSIAGEWGHNPLPLPTPEAFRAVIDELAQVNPKAKGQDPRKFYDDSIVQELEKSGFINALYR